MPKVSDLDELTAGNVATDDELYVVDGGAASKRASVETILGVAKLLTSFQIGDVKLADVSGDLSVKNAADAAKGVIAGSFTDATGNVLVNTSGVSIANDAKLLFSSTAAASGSAVAEAYSATGSTTFSVTSLAKASATASHAFQFLGFKSGAAYEGMRIFRNDSVVTPAWVIDVISDGSTYDGRASRVIITTNDNRTAPLSTGYPVLDLSNFGNRNRAITAGPAADPSAVTIMVGGVPATLTAWGDGPDSYFSILDSAGRPMYIPVFSSRPVTGV